MAVDTKLILVALIWAGLYVIGVKGGSRSRAKRADDTCPPCDCPVLRGLSQPNPGQGFDPLWSSGYQRCSVGNIASYTDLFVTMVTTYDGEDLAIVRDQKTLLSRNDDVPTDPCKFQLRVVTDDDANNNPNMLYVGWVGISFGVHTKDSSKFGRNLMIGHKEIRERGQHGAGAITLPYHFRQVQPDGRVTDVSMYQDGDVYVVHSSTCAFRLVYYKGALVDNFVFFAGDEYRNRMTGMCGDANGSQDDRKLLDGTPSSDIRQISDSFAEGAHQRITDNESAFDR